MWLANLFLTLSNESWKVFMILVCQSVSTITSVNILWLRRNSHVNKSHISMFPITNPICSNIFLEGRSKEIWYITVNKRYLLEVNFRNVKISLTKRNFYMSLRSTPVCCSLVKMTYVAAILSLQDRTKEIQYNTQ